MVLSNSQTTLASLHCSGQWLHAKLLSALFKTRNVKPMKSTALISRFCWLSYGSLDLRWNGFLAVGTMKGLHWKLKRFCFHLVQQIFLPQWPRSLAPGDKSDVTMSACKSWGFMLQNKYPAERKLFPLQVCSAITLFPHTDTRLLCSAKHKCLDMGCEVTKHLLYSQIFHLHL